MRIDRIEIYGFGHLKEVELAFDEGINIVEGMNEAGKSTLMAFIRAMLFGFESRRNPEKRYEPLDGGRLGGILEITDDNGRTYRIERVSRHKVAGDVTVYLPDGGEAGEEMLAKLLGRLNKNVFNRIFSFGLTELQELDSLREDEINQFIYTAGTGDGQVILDARKELDEREQQLFKKNARKKDSAVINARLHEIKETRQELQRLKQENAEYDQLVKTLEELDEELDQLDQTMDKTRKEAAWYEKLIQQVGAYETYVELEDRLGTIPDIDQFPEEGVARLEMLEKSIRSLKGEQNNLEEKRKHLLQKDEQIEINSAILDKQDEITLLKEEWNMYREYREQLNRLETENKQLDRDMEDKLSQLGPDWTRNKAKSMDTSVAVKQSVTDYAHRFKEMREKVRTAENRHEDAIKETEKWSRRLQEWLAKEPSFAPGRDESTADRTTDPESAYQKEIDRQLQGVEQARSLLNQIRDTDSERNLLQEQVRQQAEMIQMFRQASPSSSSAMRKWGPGIATILIPLTLWALLGTPWVPAVTFVLLAGVTLYDWRKGQQPASSVLPGELEQKQQELEKQLARVDQELERLLEEADRLLLDWNRTGPLDESLLQKWESNIETMRDHLREWKDWNRTREERKEALQQAERELADRKQELMQLREASRKLEADWQKWLIQKEWIREQEPGQPQHQEIPTPDLILDMLRTVEALRERLRRGSEIAEEMARLTQFMDTYRERIDRVCQETGISLEEEEPEFQVRQLVRMLDENRQLEKDRQKITEQLQQVEGQLQKIEHRLNEEQQARDQLLAAGGASDPETFRKRAAYYKEREQLQFKISEIRQSFRRITANDEQALSRFLNTLKESSRTQLNHRFAELNQQLKEWQAKQNELREERSRIRSRLDSLASGETLSDLNYRYHRLVGEMQEYARDWAITVMTRHVMQKAMEIYEREKQPGVLKRASKYLQVMTDGRYVRILAPLGENKIEVERGDGRRLEPAYLSRGTVEQLYLAMRFALVEEYGKQALLPMILDDIFVNFDPERMKRAVRTLQEAAKERQIFFFTCHPHISRLFQEEAVTHQKILLPSR
ncbi:MAG: AAA family ATPase [Bacillaceae bacterium]|nr:AAA family ATPase [Bacillaceae bacterium]